MSAGTPDINDPRLARARAMREAGAETAEIARACGVMGSNRAYLEQMAHQLQMLGIHDDYVVQLLRRVQALGGA